MQYGIEQNVLVAPFSLILSILLCIGLINFGYLIQKFFFEKVFFFEFKKVYIFFSPLVGIYVIIFPLYLVLIFELNFQFIIKIFSYLLLFLYIAIVEYLLLRLKFFKSKLIKLSP